jgi:hypothetical protein
MELIGPSVVLAVLVGAFWTSLVTLLSGQAGARLPFVLLLAALGAWAGDALGGRLGLDLLRIGDFRLLAASLGALAGIGLATLIAVLGPARRAGPGRRGGGRL